MTPKYNDQNGVPLLAMDLNTHFERLAVFLAYRNVFPGVNPLGGMRQERIAEVRSKIVPLYEQYLRLTPYTSLESLVDILVTLLDRGVFALDSPISDIFSDISDEQIRTRDLGIIHRLPLPVAEFETGAAAGHKMVAESMDDIKRTESVQYVGARNDTQIATHVDTVADNHAPRRPALVTQIQFTTRSADQLKPVSRTSDSYIESSEVTNGENGTPQLLQPSNPIQSFSQFLELVKTHDPTHLLTAQQLPRTRRPRKDMFTPPKPGTERGTSFSVRHLLLTTTQHLLEEACFYFAKKWLPARLRDIGWVTPEQGELNKWWGIIKGCQVLVEAVNFGDLDVEYLFREAAELRHAAVHRLNEEKRTLDYFLKNAMLVLLGVKDYSRAHKLRQMQAALEMREWEMLNKAIAEPLHLQSADFQIPRIENPSDIEYQASRQLEPQSTQQRLNNIVNSGRVAHHASRRLSASNIDSRNKHGTVKRDLNVMENCKGSDPIIIDLTMDSD